MYYPEFRRLFVLVLALISVRGVAQDSTKTNSHFSVLYSDLRIKYSGLKDGYFEGGINLYRSMREGIYRFYEHGVYIGFSPWQESLIIESSNYFTFFIFSFGGSISYADNITMRRSVLCVRPEAGFNFNLFQVYYGYSLAWSNDVSYWQLPHNIVVSISICSTTAFYPKEKYEKIHWGGI